MDFSNLRVSDLKLIEQLPFATSIRELARQQKIDPQNLTKRLKYIEEIVGHKLVDRSVSGISLNQDGQRTVQVVTESLKLLQSVSVKTSKLDKRIRTCGRGFMIDYFLYKGFSQVCEKHQNLKFDFMDLSPELTERSARQGLLDFVFSFDDILLGDNWKKVSLKPVEWKFVVRRGHPLCRNKKITSLQKYDIVSFCYIESDRFISRESPLQRQFQAGRSSGAENSRYALSVVESSNAVAYLPDISLVKDLEQKQISIIELDGFDSMKKTLCLHFNKDTLKMSEVKSIVSSLKV